MIRVPGGNVAIRNEKRLREILARVTTFYPDRVENLFKTVTRGTTLRDIHQPVPEEVRKVLEELENQGEESGHLDTLLGQLNDKRKASDELEAERAARQRRLNVAWLPLRDVIRVLARHAELERDLLEALLRLDSPTPQDLTDLMARLRAGPETAPATVALRLVDTIKSLLDREIKLARERAARIAEPESLRRRKVNIEQEVEAIESRYPDLGDFVQCFAPEQDDQQLPDLLEVFQTLAEHTEHWIENANRLPDGERDKLSGVLTELRAVMSENARQRALELGQWLTPLQEEFRRYQQLADERNLLEREMERYRMSQDVEALESARLVLAEHRRPFMEAYRKRYGWDLLARHQDDIDELALRLDKARSEVRKAKMQIEQAASPDRDIYSAVADFSERVLGRFALVDGILPLKVEEIARENGTRNEDELSTRVTTADHRSLQQLSTGQRAQVAVALAVVQTQLLGDNLPFRILLLDDVSTAYDLSNITREAVLWRQLAYNQDKSNRWQLFISSHHEDLTNHLLDLLIPPSGMSLRLLKFTNWSPTTRPSIESFNVEESGLDSDTARDDLKNALKEELCRLF
jgi:DNA repair exonuclease SbcCD ATPase subunit